MVRNGICRVVVGLVAVLALVPVWGQVASSAPPSSAAERLYVLNCGEGVAGDISRWSPGVNVGQSQGFSDSCYLIKHHAVWLLWDTGLPDAVADMPDGLRPSDPRAIHWRRPVTLAAQLAQIGVAPADIAYVALSHSHPDHIGNVGLFTHATLLLQRAEYAAAAGSLQRLGPAVVVQPIDGDWDVFGDGSVTLIATPGHTAGHQSLLVKLPQTGVVLLTGDAVHFQDNWDHRRVPSINYSAEQTSASMQKLADIMAREHAQLWINHDKAQRDGQRLSPAFYE